MLRDRYAPVDLFARAPALTLTFEPVLARLYVLLGQVSNLYTGAGSFENYRHLWRTMEWRGFAVAPQFPERAPQRGSFQ